MLRMIDPPSVGPSVMGHATGRKIVPRMSVTKGPESAMIHPYWLAPGLNGSALARETRTRVTTKTILVVEDDRAIAKRLIDAHGGVIEADSTMGQGTTMTI